MSEEEYNKKYRFYKYVCIFFATLIGAFLAVYFVTDIAINRAMNPYHIIKKMDREFTKMDRAMKYVTEVPSHHFIQHNTVDFFRTPEEYKFVVDLKPFGNDANNIQITTNDSSITLRGEATINKEHSETFTSFSQTYNLEVGANLAKMTKKKEHNKLVITIPVEENNED